MTIEKAFAEMKRRGWGFGWMGNVIFVGPIMNKDYAEKGIKPLIMALGQSTDPALAVERAIEAEEKNAKPQ